MNNKLYLGELLERDNVEYSSNNLIVSPTGSGKTYHMMRDLKSKFDGKVLMLVSTSSLKYKLGKLEEVYTTQDVLKKKLNIENDDVYLMSYAEFGYKVLWNNKFIKDFSIILCDEIHSLFEYFSYTKAHNLAAAIKVLFDKHDDKKIFYYTASTFRIDDFIDRENRDLYEHVNIFDYYDNPNIMKYINYIETEITSTDEIEDVIISLGDLNYAGKKGVIFNERISSMSRIKELLSRKGLKSIEIWSINNKDNLMNDEQIYVRNYLLENERIPDEYDFIIFNGAMREGWDLNDERVVVAIMNTLDETNREQARGRLRQDLPWLVTRVKGKNQPIDLKILKKEKLLGIIEKILNKQIDVDDKLKIAESFNVRHSKDGRLVKWPTIQKVLEENGYKIESIQTTIDGQRKRVSVVTKPEVPVKLSTSSKASKFLAKLGNTRFNELNKDFLDNYVNKDSRIAFSNIKSAYQLYVDMENGWTERKFVDVTYLLARDKKIFNKSNYVEYGLTYLKRTKVEVLTERAKYEPNFIEDLECVKLKEKAQRQTANAELSKYIAENSLQ